MSGIKMSQCTKNSIHGLFFLFTFYAVLGYGMLLDDDRDSNNFTATIGDYIVFNCHLDFPHEIPIPYILHWNREIHSGTRLTLQGRTVFSWYEVPGYQRANSVLSIADDYAGRIHLVDSRINQEYGQGSINLTNIRDSDQGWYECKVIFPDRSPSSRNNGTWFYLSIEGLLPPNVGVSGENLLVVPPINRTVMEGDIVEFDCVTKDPNMIITWLRDGVEIPELEVGPI
ncbi:hypothetical protein PV328_004366 [Microctonus aethiopoides]|uniref:Ig-like domain-containing protein n=1 Tax=Microctonus aethiopoides TaxID=144406 RepID=A0AA39FAC9_9HYME|nr:hypothetical protein PV328_004366 [Microctonus aethiopoides]